MFPGISFLLNQACIAVPAMLSAFVILVSGMFGRKPVQEKTVIVPSSGRPIPPSSSQRSDSIMAVVRQLEAYLDRINAGGVREAERNWQNKLRVELDSIKRAVASGDFAAARRRLSSAELYVKMLELHLASR